MTDREIAVKALRIAGQELMERAEELVCNVDEGIKDIDVWISIPSRSDDPARIPEIQINTRLYPKKTAIYRMLDLAREEGMQ